MSMNISIINKSNFIYPGLNVLFFKEFSNLSLNKDIVSLFMSFLNIDIMFMFHKMRIILKADIYLKNLNVNHF